MADDVPTSGDLIQLGQDVKTAAEKAYRDEIARMAGPEGGGTAVAMIPDDEFDNIPSWFEKFDEPWPSYAEAQSIHIQATIGAECLDSGEVNAIDELKSHFGNNAGTEWHGASAENFDTYFLTPFADAVDNQRKATNELDAAMQTWADILGKRRKDAQEVGKQTIKKLESLGGCGSAEATLGLSLLGVAAGIIGTVVSGGTLTFVLIGAAATTLNSVIAAAKSIDGSTVHSVVDSMTKALTKIDEDVDDRAQQLADKLEEDNTTVTDQIGKDKSGDSIPVLLPYEPRNPGSPSPVTGGGTPGGFEPPTSGK